MTREKKASIPDATVKPKVEVTRKLLSPKVKGLSIVSTTCFDVNLFWQLVASFAVYISSHAPHPCKAV